MKTLIQKKSLIIEPSGKLLLLFSQIRRKAPRGKKIILSETEKHISDDKKNCKIFNDFFSNVVSDLKIPDYCNYFPQKNTCSLSTIMETFDKHRSILNIKKRKLDSEFSFRKTTQEEVLKVIRM